MAYIDNVTNILQIQPDGLPTFVRLSQNENGRNLYFQLAGNEIDIPANATITISGTKPDGTVYSGTGSISDNVILIPEMIQMTAVAGYWDAKVKIISGGNTIATGRIRFVIDADTVDPDSVPSDSELEGLVAEAQQYAETARTEAYGSPLTATTAAGMTDHTRVYVYTGSETGYTAGHWYYWDGTQWADGGIYNSTATNTDPTLTLAGVPADAKATGDAIEAARVAIDDTLTNEGEAADAAAVGSEISGLKEDLLQLYSAEITVEQGYWAIASGNPSSSATWCRSKSYIPHDIAIISKDPSYVVVLLAYSSDGTYIGAWDGSAFTKIWSYGVGFKNIDVNTISKVYPNYCFRVDFYKDGQSLTPSDVEQNYDVIIGNCVEKFDISVDITEVGKMYFFPVKQGDSFIVKSLSGSFNYYKLKLYDYDGKYLNYYGLPGGTSRAVTSTLDFAYVAITDAPSISASITNNSRQFDESAYADTLQAIGKNRTDITRATNRFTQEKTVSESIVRKYGGDNAPVLSDAYFAWITDVHAEVDRMKQFSEMVSEFGKSVVPFALNTGDTVSNVIGDGIAWYDNIVSSMSIPVLNTVGNHDAYTTNGVYESDKTVVYNEIISPFVSGWDVTQPENASVNGYCYYYKDIGAVRLIVLDSAYWDSTQKTWFESVLADSATNNKHVVVACHAPFSANLCTMVDTAWNTGFLSRDSTIMSTEALTCVQNFKSSGGAFVAWLQGHVHGDEVVTLESGSQLAVCNNSFSNRGTKVYKTSDKANYNYNSCNVVAIDVSNNLLKLYRVGANITVTGKKHNGLVWNYASNTLVDEW